MITASHKALVSICVAVLCLAGIGLAQDETPPANGRLAGKVSSLIPRTRKAEVVGRERDFSRLMKTEAKRDALKAKFATPLSVEERRVERKRRLSRYGASHTSSRTELSTLGLELEEERKRVPARGAAEPEEDSSNTTLLVLLGIFAGAMYFIFRARN